MKKLICVRSLYDSARLCISPIWALYLSSKGLDSHSIVSIKSVQAITFLALDLPSGLLICRMGNYNATLFSLFLAVGGFVAYIFGTSLAHFLAAEFLYASSVLLWPSAFNAYAIHFLKIDFKEDKINKYTHLSFACSSIFIIIATFIGAYVYPYWSISPYLLGIFLFILCLAVLYRAEKLDTILQPKQSSNSLSFSNFKGLHKIISSFKNEHAFSFVLLFGIQYFLQPFLHYWQLLFCEKIPEVTTHILACFPMLVCILNFLLSYSFSCIRSKSIILSTTTLIITLCVTCILVCFSLLLHSVFFLFIFTASIQSILFLAQNMVLVQINSKLKDDNRQIMTKFAIFTGRIGMLLSLAVLCILARDGIFWKTTISSIYSVYYFKFILFFFFVFMFYTLKLKKLEGVKDGY